MISNGNRRNGKPIHILENSANALERVSLTGGEFNEEWIQKLIYAHPGILPVGEIEASFTPLIAIGREISTSAGFLDNLFVSPEGYITIVETKLWRNPEARREVVGQIIDYAKELSKWTFTDLNNAVISSSRSYNNSSDGLLDILKKHGHLTEQDDHFIIDNISRNLKRGRFLLLIVGDGIRESVEDMIEYLSLSPQVHFTLALVELQVFKLNDAKSSLIVIPQVVTRTEEITRAIIRIEGSYGDLNVNIETDLGTESENKKTNVQRLTIAAEDYFEQLKLNSNSDIVDFAKQIILDAQESGYYIEWNTGSFGVKLPDPQGSGLKITLFTVDKFGKLYFGYSRALLDKLGLAPELSYNLAIDTASLLNLQQNQETKYSWNKYSSLKDLQPVYHSFMARMASYANEIVLAGQNLNVSAS